MKLSILHPSRSRPHEALQTIVHWLQNILYPQAWEYILSVDSSDPMLSEYEWLNVSDIANIRMIVNGNQNAVHASNQAAKVATGDILILVSDDFKCFKGWNLKIIEALEGKSGVLKTFDGVQKWIVTLPIMTIDYYKEQGYLYYPVYPHLFSDTDLTHKADLQKKLIIRNDIVFRHVELPKDGIKTKSDDTWNYGEKVYLQRCRSKFGLTGLKTALNLSPEAHKAGHVNWLKRKGIRV